MLPIISFAFGGGSLWATDSCCFPTHCMILNTMNTRIQCLLAVILMACCCLHAQAQTVADFVHVPNPDDLEVDRFGNVWVNYREGTTPDVWHLAKITPDGVVSNVITRNYELGQFGINDSTIWIAGPWAQGVVYKCDHAGNELDTMRLTAPTAIILDPDGTWYIAQNALGRLTKILPDKSRQVLASGSPLNHNLALARDEHGMFYTCNLNNARVIKIDPATGEKTLITTLPTASPYSLGFLAYHRGSLYVPSGRHCLYKVDTAATGYSLFTGTELTPGDQNGSVATALLNTPISVAFSTTGDTLFFTDSGNNKIKMITGMNVSVGVGEPIQRGGVSIQIFPNPVLETVAIRLADPHQSIVSISIISVEGRTVDSIYVPEGIAFYDYPANRLPAASYTVRVVTSKGEVSIQHIVKLR